MQLQFHIDASGSFLFDLQSQKKGLAKVKGQNSRAVSGGSLGRPCASKDVHVSAPVQFLVET